MKLLQALRIAGTDAEHKLLRETMRSVAAASNYAGRDPVRLEAADSRILLRVLQDRFGLPDDLAALAISNARSIARRPVSPGTPSRTSNAVAFDEKQFGFRMGPDRLSIATTQGWITVPVAHLGYFFASERAVRGHAEIAERRGRLVFFVVVEVPDSVPLGAVGHVPPSMYLGNAAPSANRVAARAARRHRRDTDTQLRLVASHGRAVCAHRARAERGP